LAFWRGPISSNERFRLGRKDHCVTDHGRKGGVTSEPDQHNYGPYDAALCFHWVTYLPSAMKFSADPNNARNGPGSSGAERQSAAMAGVIPRPFCRRRIARIPRPPGDHEAAGSGRANRAPTVPQART